MKYIFILLSLLFIPVQSFSQDFWEKTSTATGTVFSFSPDSAGGFFAGTYNSVLRTTDAGITWNQLIKGGTYTNYIAFGINKKGHIYVGTHSNNIPKTTDNGNSWTNLTTLGHPDPRPIIFLENGDMFAVPYSAGMHKSTDEGLTWTNNFPGMDSGLRVLALIQDKSGVVWAGTDNHLFKSSDNGNNWTKQIIDSLCPQISSLLILKDGSMLAGSGSYKCGIFRSADNGNSWEKVFQGLDLYYYDFVFNMIQSPNEYIYASTNGYGVYESRDKGLTARRINLGIDSTVVFWWQLGIDPSGHLFVGTNKGMYKSKGLVTGVSVNQPQNTMQYNAYFSDNMLKIECMNTKSSEINLELFTIQGLKVLSGKNNNTTDKEIITTDCTDLSAGCYFYRIISGTEIYTGKVLRTE